MTLDEAHRLALKILKEVMEEKVDENNIQLAQVSLSHPRSTSD
jgi:20S proteasome subunit alpha 5